MLYRHVALTYHCLLEIMYIYQLIHFQKVPMTEGNSVLSLILSLER